MRSPSNESKSSDPSHPYETPKPLPQLLTPVRTDKTEEEEPSYEPVGLKIEDTETENLDIVHFCRGNEIQNHEGDLENSDKHDGKSFIVTVIDKIKSLSKDERDEVDENNEKTISKEEKKRKKKEQEQEEKLLKTKKIEEQQRNKQEEQEKLEHEKKQLKMIRTFLRGLMHT